LGAGEQVDVNFEIEVEKDLKYYPIMLAAARGEPECIEILLKNMMINIDLCEEKTKVNAFWLACFFGRGECVRLLANSGIDILNTHK